MGDNLSAIPVQSNAQVEQRLRSGPIIRDVIIVWVLTYIGGFILGLAGASRDTVRYQLALGVSNVLLGTVAFTISGFLAPPAKKWHHLELVALFAWLTGVMNVLFFHYTVAQWIAGALFMAIMMCAGGGISSLLKKAA